MSDHYDNYRLLLEKAGRLYERHEAGRRETFNVFSVLRSEHDEVNLHSRFLAALLDYRKSQDGRRENLADFLRSVDIRDFDQNHAAVERESGNIDILIRDRVSKQAVVIENKIRAGDQPRQLQRYAEQLEEKGYGSPHLLYLTLDGHDPSEDSAGSLKPECISFGDILPWLKRCQERAYDEPALRESVAQYVRLIEKLTGTDFSEAYMSDLKKLCLQDNNLVLVHDLNEAMVGARIELLQKLWQEIDCELRGISDLQEIDHKLKEIPLISSDISKETVERFVRRKRGYRYHGLYYKFSPCAALSVEAVDPIFFGVKCEKEKNKDDYDKLKETLGKKLDGGWSDDKEGDRSVAWWPWWRNLLTDLNLKYPTREHFERLANEKARKDYVAEVVSGVSEVWDRIKSADLIR